LRLGGGLTRLLAAVGELGHDDGRENAKDYQHEQQFDEREAAALVLDFGFWILDFQFHASQSGIGYLI
jgi:hypothetical protein